MKYYKLHKRIWQVINFFSMSKRREREDQRIRFLIHEQLAVSLPHIRLHYETDQMIYNPWGHNMVNFSRTVSGSLLAILDSLANYLLNPVDGKIISIKIEPV
jgi:hypothetical protein